MWRIGLVILVFSFLQPPLFSQQDVWEIGGGVGSAHYLGDIGGREEVISNFGPSDLILSSTRFTAGAMGRLMLNYRLYSTFQLNYIMLHGEDRTSVNTSREGRNLDFSNHVIEATGRIEYHPVIIRDLGNKRRFRAGLHWYVFLGLGVIYHNPYTEYNGETVFLPKLQTEGPDKKYSQVQPVVPMGTGFFIKFKDRGRSYMKNRIGLDINYRYTPTDYLDDISTSYPDASTITDPVAKDLYYRGWELKPGQEDPNTRVFPNEGGRRGDPDHNDVYFTVSIYYVRLLSTGKRRFKIPRYEEFYGRSRKKRRSKL
ncbi:MAG TPA: hypothetical protein DDX92_13270 [Flavobacteriales bacterium]|jgi:hypothetical protein|nr:hypothetical protein [Flavobacteriales bacterium]